METERKKFAKRKDMRPLAEDYSSFDILWFDIVTKARVLVAELCEPMIERSH